VKVFRVMPDQRFAYMRPSPRDYQAWKAKMMDGMLFEQSARGVPLQSRWNESWEFIVDEEDLDQHPGGLGDFADMNKLIATRERGFRLLKPLLGEAAEILKGRFAGQDLWLFNVVRHVGRDALERLEQGAVFRVEPVGLDILCASGFKEAVEASGLTGLRFREVRPEDRTPMI
jgi:hypothetical protein